MEATKVERGRIWESAKLIVMGLRNDEGKDFGIYEVYDTLKGQFERGELTSEQKTAMGIKSIEIIEQSGVSAKPSGIFIEGGLNK
jgi:hypothetical protein